MSRISKTSTEISHFEFFLVKVDFYLTSSKALTKSVRGNILRANVFRNDSTGLCAGSNQLVYFGSYDEGTLNSLNVQNTEKLVLKEEPRVG